MPKPGEMRDPRASRPSNDGEYLERMSRAIFAAGLNWSVIDKKWPGIRAAFHNFDIEAVASFGEPELDELMQNTDVVRNLPKLRAVVQNASVMQELIKTHGSFGDYLDQLSSQGEDQMRAEISRQFSFLGPGTTVVFLYSVGQDLPKATDEWHRRHSS